MLSKKFNIYGYNDPSRVISFRIFMQSSGGLKKITLDSLVKKLFVFSRL